MGVSLIENHLLRATIMLQQSTSLRQGIVYPTKGIRFDCLMDPLDYCEKGSSKEYDPLLSMVATWFMRLWAVWTLPHISAPCYSQKYTSSYVLKTYGFCDLRLVLKILSSKAIFEITIPLLGSVRKIFLINWKLCQRLFGNLNFSSF